MPAPGYNAISATSAPRKDPWFTRRPLVVLAPMEGVTDSPYRRIVREVAPHTVLFTEFTSAKGLVYGSDRTWRMVEFAEEERPVVAQIFGSEPEVMADAARKLEERWRPDGIDINFGCPVRKVVKRGEGCALMKDPARATAIVQAVREAIHVPLTGKIRLGFERKEECVPFACVLEEAGVDLISVHGRLRNERPRVAADWTWIARVKEAVSVPVVGNGDVYSGRDALRFIERSGVDGVMVARAAMGNPWIMAEVHAALAGGGPSPAPSLARRVHVTRRHMEWNIECFGERTGVITMRKHFGNYLTGFPGAKEIRSRLNEAVTREQVLVVLGKLEEAALTRGEAPPGGIGAGETAGALRAQGAPGENAHRPAAGGARTH